MWSVFFIFLSYLDGNQANVKRELSALHAKKDSHVSYFLLNTTSCAESSACRVGLSTQEVVDGNSVSARRETEDKTYSHTLRRSKRGFTYPGTLWCGAGNIADNYDQLGEFAETDKCCRTHDHCSHVIHAFSSKYGFTNFKWHSISHCDCDNEMKQCLRAVNDTSSRVVGQAFFNVIEVPCFEFSFEEQCVERHWYGLCKRYDKAPVAVIRESAPYDFGDNEVIDEVTTAPPIIKLSEMDEGKQDEMPRSQSMTQSSVSGAKNPVPEEPSLTNVVTAAEDFIKVLATVSTSQSSTTNGGNTGETQASDKKRKKNAGKKEKDSKKTRRKGKVEKRKQNKANVSITGAPSSNREADTFNKSSFVEDTVNFDWLSKNDNLMNSPFSSVVDIEHTNKMMRDEQKIPVQSQVGTTTSPDAKQEVKILELQKQIKDISRQRVEKNMQIHSTPTSHPVKDTLRNMMGGNTSSSTAESTSSAGLTTHIPISLPGEEAPHNAESQHEKGSAFYATTQNTPIVGTKRQRLRQKGGRRKSQKRYSPSSSTDALTTEPTVLLTDTIQQLFPEVQSGSWRLQSNGPMKIAEKHTTGVTGEFQLKTLKRTDFRKRIRQLKSILSLMEDDIKSRHEAIAITSTDSGVTDLVPQIKDAEPSTGQLFSSRRQTMTSSILPLKTRISKQRSRKRDEKRRKIKRHVPLCLTTSNKFSGLVS